MKILLIGNGGREHAIAEALHKSKKCTKLICFASKTNPGIKRLCYKYKIGNLVDFKHIEEFSLLEKPDFAVLGPEDPISLGMADKLAAIGIPSVGPKQMLARLESSKSFTRKLLTEYNLAHTCPQYKTVTNLKDAEEFIKKLNSEFVIKMDSLCGGKGVKVMGDHFLTAAEGLIFAKDCIEGGGKVLIEEKLIGQEFSLMSFVDGKTVIDMPVIQDHKRAFEGDKGPNTGGMGSYSYPNNLPFLTKKDLDDAHNITVQVMQALEKECGEIYQGIMYGGFIATKQGIKIIEYNARFGDPECLNVFSVLKTDFVDICLAIINQNLDKIKIEFEKKATVCKYVVPEGYPTNPKAGEKIIIGNIPDNVKLFYAAVNSKNNEIYLSSSRAIGLVGVADNIELAEQAVENVISQIKGPVFHRKDIGTKELIQSRIDMMNKIKTS